MGRNGRSVKPSAKPTLVRTQHLPPPAKIARELGFPGLAGLLVIVPPCFVMCRCEPLRSSGYGHMADGIRPEPAVHRTACSTVVMVHPVVGLTEKITAYTLRGSRSWSPALTWVSMRSACIR